MQLARAMDGYMGGVIERALDLDGMLQMGFMLGPDDVTLREYGALQILRDERQRFESEQG